MSQDSEVRNAIIIGSGPAGLTAAIYLARGGLNPLMIEGYQSGGQLMLTSDVENFPGFAKGVMGPELMQSMRAQAERFGTKFITADVTKVELEGTLKKVWVDNAEHFAKTVIVSTGASANWLGLPSEQKLLGRGVSSCATCDGFFFKGQPVAVIGGGDSAMEEANYLSRLCSKVYLIHRRDTFRASKIMVERAMGNPKIEMVINSAVEEMLGEKEVEGIRLKNTVDGSIKEIKVSGIFVAIGHTPNTKLFHGQIQTNENGYIFTSTDKGQICATNIPGVFACGDVQDSRYRQAVTAAGSGCAAALDAEHFLDKHQ